MALRASTRNPQTVRFVFDADASAGYSYTINRTLAIADASAVFSTSAVGQNLLVQKAAATCVTITTNNTANEVRPAATLDLANAYFISGDTMVFQTSAAGLRGIAYVTVLPGITSTS
jgi:hypothetical protein